MLNRVREHEDLPPVALSFVNGSYNGDPADANLPKPTKPNDRAVIISEFIERGATLDNIHRIVIGSSWAGTNVDFGILSSKIVRQIEEGSRYLRGSYDVPGVFWRLPGKFTVGRVKNDGDLHSYLVDDLSLELQANVHRAYVQAEIIASLFAELIQIDRSEQAGK